MKRFLLLCVLGLTFKNVNAQVNFTSAGTPSGVVNTDQKGAAIGYTFSSSTASFSYGTSKEVTIPANKAKGDTIAHPRFSAHNYTVTTNVSNSSGSIFSGGQFDPGFTFAYEYVLDNNEFRHTNRYLFIRPTFSMQQNTFVTTDATDTLRTAKKFNVAVGGTPGINWIYTDKRNADMILAVSVPIVYNLNPVDELTSTNYSTDYKAAANGFTETTKTGYKTTQANYFSITPKLDYVWTPWIITDPKSKAEMTRIGFITTLSGLYNTREDRMACNFAFGPSIHPAGSTSSVISALQAEFTDFTNSTGKKAFKDIFAMNFYVGIPLALK